MMKLRPKEERHFRDLEKHVYKNIRNYNNSEIENVYYSLTNYCVNNIAAGEYRFSKDLYNIHIMFEKNDFYANKKDIHYSDFLSVVISSLNMKEPVYAEYFHNKYRGNIAHDFKRDTINLSLSLILFSKKKYTEALQTLNKVAYKYAYFYLKSKETVIKIYYEQKEFELIESVVDAAKHYLKRHKDIMFMHYDRYMLFFNMVIRMMKIGRKDKAEIKELMKDLDIYRNAIAREWLVEKLIEIK
jgi:hypothetical protein